MTKYGREFTKNFLKDIKKIKSHYEIQERLKNKIEEIIEDPSHYKPLRNILKNHRRVQIGSFVLIFEINKSEKLIIFQAFKHHNEVYNN